jgi:predicted O-methyltransferase YrrM
MTEDPAVTAGGGLALGEDDLAVIAHAEGWLTPDEAQLIAGLAATIREGEAIVEVGSYRGRSTIALALGSLKGQAAPVYAVEPHEDFRGPLGGEFGPRDRREFFRNLLAAGVVEQVRLINLTSQVVAPGWRRPIGLLWVDGDHSYEAVRRDLGSWEPHLAEGAVIAFHDAFDRTLGVARVVEELLATRRFEATVAVGDIRVIRKRSGFRFSAPGVPHRSAGQHA